MSEKSENASTDTGKNDSDRKKIKLQKGLFSYNCYSKQLKFVCICKNDRIRERKIFAFNQVFGRGVYCLIVFIDNFYLINFINIVRTLKKVNDEKLNNDYFSSVKI